MSVRSYQFVLKGLSPILLHQDSVELSDEIKLWQRDPENKNLSVAGDDRSPPWAWRACCYTDGNTIGVPSDNLMVALRDAGASLVISGRKTYKSVTQSGLLIPELHLPIELEGGKTVSAEDVAAIDGTFKEHTEAVKKLGFTLFVKRAKVGQAKHVRVRPRFDNWTLRGTIDVSVDEITTEVLRKLFDLAGKYKGLCDWRPSSKQSPGAWGRFEATLKAI